jgi:hypothetical protein
MTEVSTQNRQTVLETLELLDGILVEAREKVGDPDALTMIAHKLAILVEEALPRLAGMGSTPEEKAQMVQVRGQLEELERVLQTRQGILAGFSHFLKETVEG